MWDQAEGALHRALERRGLDYEINEGDGAFYGPKIDLHMSDSIDLDPPPIVACYELRDP